MKSFIVSLLVFSSAAFASEALTTNSFEDVFQKVEEKVKLYGRDKVLVVLDIDNTLLTMGTDLGSDQWFSWQEELMKNSACEPICVTNDFKKLLEYQEMLFNLGKMQPTERTLPSKIKSLQNRNQQMLLLTSRGTSLRYVTEKSLAQNGFNFTPSAMGDRRGIPGTYLPYELGNYARYSLTPEDVRVSSLKEARPVSYQNGIYMTEGQNKGIMLKVLLNKYRTEFQSIIFVDDHQRHVDRMQAILGTKLDVTTFRYGRIDEAVERFKRNTQQVTQSWMKLKRTLNDIGFSI
jgi:hypothetical protein